MIERIHNKVKFIEMIDCNNNLINILTKREFECLNQLAHGKNRKETAHILGLSPRTVDTHLEKARDRLNCHTNSELITIWWKNQQ